MQDQKTQSNDIASLDTRTATDRLRKLTPEVTAKVLAAMPVGRATAILAAMSPDLRAAVIAVAPSGTDWADSQLYPEGSVGRLLEDPPAVFLTGTLVKSAVDELRELVQQRMVVYLFVVDERERLLGVVAFRELLYAAPGKTLDDVMTRSPFYLKPATPLVDAMREVVKWYDARRVERGVAVAPGRKGGMARFAQWFCDGSGCRHRDVCLRRTARRRRSADPRRGLAVGDDGELCALRRGWHADSSRAQTRRRRPGNGLFDPAHHGDRCVQHGLLSRPCELVAVVAMSWPTPAGTATIRLCVRPRHERRRHKQAS